MDSDRLNSNAINEFLIFYGWRWGKGGNADGELIVQEKWINTGAIVLNSARHLQKLRLLRSSVV